MQGALDLGLNSADWMTSSSGCLSPGLLGLLVLATGGNENGTGQQVSDACHRGLGPGVQLPRLGDAGDAGTGMGFRERGMTILCLVASLGSGPLCWSLFYVCVSWVSM